jgi:hypothetical protein
MTYQRIQLRRTKGWRKADGAVVVARPTRWGNPFPVVNGDRELAVARFREWIKGPHSAIAAEDLAWLRGKDLCCWCPLDGPCHADVLLELANKDGDS